MDLIFVRKGRICALRRAGLHIHLTTEVRGAIRDEAAVGRIGTCQILHKAPVLTQLRVVADLSHSEDDSECAQVCACSLHAFCAYARCLRCLPLASVAGNPQDQQQICHAASISNGLLS